MSTHGFTAGIDEAEVSIVITRANGDVEDLGVVGYYNKSRRKRLLWALRDKINKRKGLKT